MNKKTEPDFTGDEHWGKGGRYVINAEGKRVPAPPVVEEAAGELIPGKVGERPDNAAPGVQIDGQGLPPAVDMKPAAEADSKKTLKERNRG